MNPSTYDVRPLEARDQTAFIDMFQRVFSQPPWNEKWEPKKIEEQLKKVMHKPGFTGWVAKNQDQPIAYLTGYAWRPLRLGGGFLFLDQLFVDSLQQGFGIGKALLANAFAQATSEKKWGLLLLTKPKSPAESFYRKHGFKPVLPFLRLRGNILLVKFCSPSHSALVNAAKMFLAAHFSHTAGKPAAPSGLEIKLYNSFHDVPQPVWNACNRRNDIFLSPGYLEALEQAPPFNMQFSYAIVSDHGRPAGIGYFQILDLDPRLHFPAQHYLLPKPPTLQEKIHSHLVRSVSHRLLVCGNALLSGEHGYACVAADETRMLQALAEAAYLIRAAGDKVVHVTLIKDFFGDRLQPSEIFSQLGYYTFDAGPNLVVSMRPNWTTFDDYLKQMRTKYRKQTTNTIRKGSQLIRRSLDLAEIEQWENELYTLYGNVADRAKFRFFFLAPGYFAELKRKLGEKFVCDGYFEGQEMIGFTTRIFNGKEMEGYTHGLRYDRNKTYDLYQNFMLDDIRVAIAAGCSRINTGRTSMAMKSSLGAEPEPMKCCMRFSVPLTNHLLKPLFYFIKPSGEYCRQPFADEKDRKF